MSKIIPIILLIFFLLLGINRMLYKNWNVLRHFGIHKFDVLDCVVHAKDIGHVYRIVGFGKDGYIAAYDKNPKYGTKIKYGHWEEDYFEKVDCP